MYKTFLLFLLFSCSASFAEKKFHLDKQASQILDKFCYNCHDEDVQKGDVRLDNLSSLSQKSRLDLLNRVQEQIYIKEMPPKKKKQPSETDRKYMTKWVSSELNKFNASGLEDKLRYPSYGNYVDHDKLFSGQVKDMPYTPARRWLVSPQIFMSRVNAIFNNKGRGVRSSFHGITNPIILPNNTGVRYYDNTILSGGHLQFLNISNKQLL